MNTPDRAGRDLPRTSREETPGRPDVSSPPWGADDARRRPGGARTYDDKTDRREPGRAPWRFALAVFLVIAGYYLWFEHRVHVLGVLPLLLPLAICLGMHVFMHRGHHGHRGHRSDRDDT